jgi:hypothetical protein
LSDRRLNDLSTEELIHALSESTDVNEKEINFDPVHEFILAFNIKQGTNKVTTNILYSLFVTWNPYKKVTRKSFMRKLYNHVPVDPSYNSIVFIDKQTKDILTAMQNYHEKKKRLTSYKFTNKAQIEKAKQFFKECDVKPGSMYIEADILFFLYDTWCYKNKRNPLTISHFTNLAKLLLDHRNLSRTDSIWFCVHEDIKKHIDVNAVLNWRRGRERRGKAKKYKVQKEDRKNIIYPEAKTKQETEE